MIQVIVSEQNMKVPSLGPWITQASLKAMDAVPASRMMCVRPVLLIVMHGVCPPYRVVQTHQPAWNPGHPKTSFHGT